jgi:hypothetical protein
MAGGVVGDDFVGGAQGGEDDSRELIPADDQSINGHAMPGHIIKAFRANDGNHSNCIFVCQVCGKQQRIRNLAVKGEAWIVLHRHSYPRGDGTLHQFMKVVPKASAKGADEEQADISRAQRHVMDLRLTAVGKFGGSFASAASGETYETDIALMELSRAYPQFEPRYLWKRVSRQTLSRRFGILVEDQRVDWVQPFVGRGGALALDAVTIKEDHMLAVSVTNALLAHEGVRPLVIHIEHDMGNTAEDYARVLALVVQICWSMGIPIYGFVCDNLVTRMTGVRASSPNCFYVGAGPGGATYVIACPRGADATGCGCHTAQLSNKDSDDPSGGGGAFRESARRCHTSAEEGKCSNLW